MDLRATTLLLILGGAVAAQGTPNRDVAQKITGLVQRLRDEKSWDAAAGKLVLIGSQAAKPLGDALEVAVGKSDHAVVIRILRTLERMGLDATPALPMFWRALGDADVEAFAYGRHISLRISNIGDPSVWRKTRSLLQSRMVQDRTNKRLREMFKTPSRALAQRGQVDTRSSAEALRKQLTYDEHNWISICQLLGRKGNAAQAAVPALLEILITGARRTARSRLPVSAATLGLHRPRPNEDATVLGRTAAEAILAIDSRCEEAAFAYGYLMNHDTLRSLRVRTARELQLLGHHVGRALPMLIVCLRHNPDPEILGTALNCLAMLGGKAKAATPHLERLTKSKNEKIAKRARAILTRLNQ